MNFICNQLRLFTSEKGRTKNILITSLVEENVNRKSVRPPSSAVTSSRKGNIMARSKSSSMDIPIHGKRRVPVVTYSLRRIGMRIPIHSDYSTIISKIKSLYKERPPHFCGGLVFALPIFTASRPATIVGVHVLNFCVRDGNRWTHMTINTNFFGDPYRIRTDVNGVRGRCLNHLTNGPLVHLQGLEPGTH